jgi:hypothetical protein
VKVAPFAGAVNDTLGGWFDEDDPAILKLLLDVSVTLAFFSHVIRTFAVEDSHDEGTLTLCLPSALVRSTMVKYELPPLVDKLIATGSAEPRLSLHRMGAVDPTAHVSPPFGDVTRTNGAAIVNGRSETSAAFPPVHLIRINAEVVCGPVTTQLNTPVLAWLVTAEANTE